MIHHTRLLTISLAFILGATILYATPRTISGTVTGEEQDALPHASVQILGTKLGVVADENGKFTLTNLEPGRYRLRASCVGFESSVIGVDVTNRNAVDVRLHTRRNYLQLDQIVVTATKTERIYQEVAVPTMVLTGKEIQESGAVDVAGAISDRLGIDLRPGRVGGQSAEIQGSDPKYLLVLIDGEPVVGKFDDRTELNSLATNRIDRIEIVKGPGSSLYGSEAMSGVINVITKTAQKPIELAAEAKSGSNDMYEFATSYGTKQANWSLLLNGSSLHEGKTQRRDYITLIANDRYDVGGKFRYFSDDDRIKGEVNANYTDNKEESRNPDLRYVTKLVRTDFRPSIKFRYRPWAEGAFKIRYSKYDRKYDVYVRRSGYHDETQSNETNETTSSAEFDYWRQFSAGYEANFGVAAQKSTYSAARISWGKGQEVFQWSVFAQSERRWAEELTTIVGARFDRNETFGDFFSPKISAMYTPSDWLKIRGSVGRGFRAPSWVELYLTFPHPAVGYEAYGNPDLKPETSVGYNLGYEMLYKRKLLWTVNGFWNDFRDQIDDYSVRPSILSYRNIGSSYSRGFETTWKWYMSQYLSASAGYQWMESYDRESENFLPHPRHSGNVRIEGKALTNRITGSLRARVSERYVQRFDLLLGDYTNEFEKFSTKPIFDATITLNGALLMNNWKEFAVTAGGTNLLDETNDLYGPYIGKKVFIALNYNFAK
ncbi:MAG: TonB-dependent receptor [bacterium]|nr:TonB-dependent receptor [bacterium]